LARVEFFAVRGLPPPIPNPGILILTKPFLSAKRSLIRFVLGSDCVDVLNVGFESPAEIDDFAGVVSKTARA
jgi:hypothetical protein